MRRLIMIAVALLPRGLRDRYREQWLADLRDAEEAGLPPADIAWGALAFAVTAPRPWPTVSVDPMRMRRVAFALAFAAAGVGLTYYPGFEYGPNLPAGLDYARFVIDLLVLGVQVVGTVGAVILISAARDVPLAERLSVWLLAVAAAAPLVATVGHSVSNDDYLYPGALAFAVAVGLILVAIILRRPRTAHPRPRAVTTIIAAAALAALGVVGYSLATSIWFARTPLFTSDPVGSPNYELWVRIKTEYEARAELLLVVSAVILVALVAGVALSGILHRAIDLRTATLAALFLIGFGCLLLAQYFALGTGLSDLTPSPAALSLLRFAVIVTVFVAVDGVRMPGRRTTAVA